MKQLKKFIPRTLYGRFFLIIVIPVLIVQLVSIYVFYYAHIDVISKHMARSVVSEMAFIKNSVKKPEYRALLNDFSGDVGLKFSFEWRKRLPKKIGDSQWRKSRIYKYINPLIDPYNRFKSELKLSGLTPYEIYEDPDSDDFIIIKVQTGNSLISFDVPIKRIASSSSYVFTLWMILTALITSVISIIFLRNQVRSIQILSNAAEKFGRGQDAPEIRPTGSQEIRSLAISFIKMKERVMRQITQRTDMLSAVSHDLRTPLTRMRLQLAMMGESDETKELAQDISDMEKLVNEYLDFARFDNQEKLIPTMIGAFLQDRIIRYYDKMGKKIEHQIELPENFEMPIKKLALRRALCNLIDNAFNYGKNVRLDARLSSKNFIIAIDDDGPGIPITERDNVFKPFYRIDDSRNLDHKAVASGSGLGLAIAMDAITSHGGRIKLSESAMGGLRVMIFIPV